MTQRVLVTGGASFIGSHLVEGLLKEGHKAFEKKYGWEYEHFWFTYSVETSIIYHDEIVNAVNELRFSEIDFVFDDFWERLQRKRLANGEIVWYDRRATCKYR